MKTCKHCKTGFPTQSPAVILCPECRKNLPDEIRLKYVKKAGISAKYEDEIALLREENARLESELERVLSSEAQAQAAHAELSSSDDSREARLTAERDEARAERDKLIDVCRAVRRHISSGQVYDKDSKGLIERALAELDCPKQCE